MVAQQASHNKLSALLAAQHTTEEQLQQRFEATKRQFEASVAEQQRIDEAVLQRLENLSPPNSGNPAPKKRYIPHFNSDGAPYHDIDDYWCVAPPSGADLKPSYFDLTRHPTEKRLENKRAPQVAVSPPHSPPRDSDPPEIVTPELILRGVHYLEGAL